MGSGKRNSKTNRGKPLKPKKNQLKAGIFLSYATMAVQGIIQIAYTPVMLRLLGKSEYGVYNLVASVISYLGLLSFGFGSAYMRFYSLREAKNDKEGIARLNGMFLTVFMVIAGIALLCGGILTVNTSHIFSGKLTEHEIQTSKTLMAIMTFNIAVTFPASVFSSIVTAHEQYIFQWTINLLRNLLNPFLTYPLLLMGYKSVSLAIVTTFLTIGSFLINIWFCLHKLKTRFLFNRFEIVLFKEICVFSSYMFLNMLTDQINWNVDKFILGKMKGSTAVAVYSIAAQINTLYISLSTAISSVFIPKVNRIVAQSNDNYTLTQLFIRIGRAQFIVLSLVLTGFFFFGEYFIQIWTGSDYAGLHETCYVIALWLLIPVTIPLIQNIGIEIQKAKNMHKFRSILYAVNAIANILISIALCPKYGGIGCAVGTAFSLIVGNIFLMNWYYQTKIGLDIFSFWKSIFQFIPALIFPCGAGFLMKNIFGISCIRDFLLDGIIYIGIYCSSLWLLGMNAEEKETVRNMVGKIHNRLAK
jgi:O-antigen/teichoic acid export membrane protein